MRPRKKHERAQHYIWEITKNLNKGQLSLLKRQWSFDKENRKYVPLIDKMIYNH